MKKTLCTRPNPYHLALLLRDCRYSPAVASVNYSRMGTDLGMAEETRIQTGQEGCECVCVYS